ncbi:MAG: hypothetical protein LBB21_02640 [Holosporaceae bacterium]|nr:hypothetical protein [Holosporaceae bacterium]
MIVWFESVVIGGDDGFCAQIFFATGLYDQQIIAGKSLAIMSDREWWCR